MKKAIGFSICLSLGIGMSFSQTPMQVKDINPGMFASNPRDLCDVNGTLYFAADDGVHGYELWKSDGTAAGTVMVKDIYPGTESSMVSFFPAMANLNGILIFAATNGTSGTEVWRSDGTAAGTFQLKDIYPGFLTSSPGYFVNYNNFIYFFADGEADSETGLFRTDGTVAGTTCVAGNMTLNNITISNNKMFFSGAGVNDGFGDELWKSDGTSGGTMLVKDIQTGSASSNCQLFVDVNGVLYFLAYTDAAGTELWKSDGTAAGTVLVKDVWPGTDNGNEGMMYSFNGKCYFQGNDGINGSELWSSNGTSAGTVMLKDIEAGASGSFPWLTGAGNYNGYLYFAATTSANGMELWRTDGTAAGTTLFKDIDLGFYSSSPSSFVNYNNKLFFTAGEQDHGFEIWSTDGTLAGTSMYSDLNPGTLGCVANNFKVSGNALFFQGDDNSGVNGIELWSIHGTATLETQNENLKLDIYPNPVADLLTVKYEAPEAAELFIYSSDGRLILRQKLALGQDHIQTGALEAGTYLLQIQSGTSMNTLRFTKQ